MTTDITAILTMGDAVVSFNNFVDGTVFSKQVHRRYFSINLFNLIFFSMNRFQNAHFFL